MRHATQSQQLSLPSDQRQALLNSLVRNLVIHGQIRTTHARAKEAQRLADRLVSLGKDGSIHARRRVFRILKDRSLVKQMFSDIAPRFVDVNGGYTRVTRLALRRGDGAQQAVLAFSRLPATAQPVPTKPQPAKPEKPPAAPKAPQAKKSAGEQPEKSKGLFEGLRSLWTRKKKGRDVS